MPEPPLSDDPASTADDDDASDDALRFPPTVAGPVGLHVGDADDASVDLDDPVEQETDGKSALGEDAQAALGHDAQATLGHDARAASLAAGKRVCLVGRWGGMTRREAARVIRSYDARIVDLNHPDVDWIVIGAEESPLAETEWIDESLRQQAADGFVEVFGEADLWQRLGLVDAEQTARQLYTPAMLAQLLGVSVRVIRRWHRRGLIQAVRTLHRLPYFDFAEVATAKRLAQWILSGDSPAVIEQRLVDWMEILPDIRRPLDQLSVLVEGKRVLLRQGEGLVEVDGQMHFDFETLDQVQPSDALEDRLPLSPPAVLAIWDEPTVAASVTHDDSPLDPLLEAAFDAEDEGDYETAVDSCHAILARDGVRADICFQIAELLYRLGEVTAARERYYMAMEADPNFVEARASLGNVLSELKQYELAIAAYEGALSLHEDYADVHYNLARLLDDLDRGDEAAAHWRRFLALSPQSPWAMEAQMRLGIQPERDN